MAINGNTGRAEPLSYLTGSLCHQAWNPLMGKYRGNPLQIAFGFIKRSGSKLNASFLLFNMKSKFVDMTIKTKPCLYERDCTSVDMLQVVSRFCTKEIQYNELCVCQVRALIFWVSFFQSIFDPVVLMGHLKPVFKVRLCRIGFFSLRRVK